MADYDKLVDIDHLALYDDKIRPLLGDKNAVEVVKRNGTALAPDASKAVDVTVPTKTSDLENDSGFQTASDVRATVEGYGYLTAVPSGYVTGADLDARGYLTAVPPRFVDEDELAACGYQTASDVSSAIALAIDGISGVSFEIVQALPQSGAGTTGTIYLISNGGNAPNVYDEYVWIESTSSFEKIGTTDVDLSGYVRSADITLCTNADIDALFV